MRQLYLFYIIVLQTQDEYDHLSGKLNRFHIQDTIKQGCGATASIAGKLLFLDLGSNASYVIKPLTISCTNLTKQSRCTNLEQPRSTGCKTSLQCYMAILYYSFKTHLSSAEKMKPGQTSYVLKRSSHAL